MSEKPKLLVVEDEVDVRELMILHLSRAGYEAKAAGDASEAQSLIEENNFDLAILDWMLPGSLSGLDICKMVHKQMPVLMVTARVSPSDIVQGLEQGADDYLTKPFEISVFLARVQALLRRATALRDSTLSEKLQTGELMLQLDAHKAFCKNEELQLTPSEFKLLTALLRNRGRVLSRAQLIELIQGKGIRVTERSIDILTFGLRKKLGACAAQVETVRGVGYRVKID